MTPFFVHLDEDVVVDLHRVVAITEEYHHCRVYLADTQISCVYVQRPLVEVFEEIRRATEAVPFDVA